MTTTLQIMTAYLIDGYNLLHALGLVSGPLGHGELERARLRLLDRLKAGFRDQAPAVTIVFDASGASSGLSRSPKTQEHHGLKVIFAPAHREADDLIEDFIRQASAPKKLTVVSNDHRLQQAAGRRKARFMKCDDFMDWLERRRAGPPSKREEADEKTGLSREENERLLNEFRELDDDLRRTFLPFEFEDGHE